MTREQEAELIAAFSDGISGRFKPEDPASPITRLRAAWSEASPAERSVFKTEISRASPAFVPGEITAMIAAAD